MMMKATKEGKRARKLAIKYSLPSSLVDVLCVAKQLSK